MKRIVVVAALALPMAGCMTPQQWDYVRAGSPGVAPAPHIDAPLAPAPPVASAAEAPAKSAFHGCLGASLQVCLDGLSDQIEEDDALNSTKQIADNEAVDVNGRPIRPGSKAIVVAGRLLGRQDHLRVTATVTYDPARVVTSVDVTWGALNPDLAHTQEEYRQAGLFDVTKLVLGDSCPSMNEISLYQFFENTIKPKIVHEDKDIEVGMDSASESYSSHATASYCGRLFKYNNSFGDDTSLITLDNPHGAFGMTTIGLYVDDHRAHPKHVRKAG